ncbi:ABC transporter ATP-binding protein [Oribacterium sp. C9]|uniref:ABC transporter ATP-binding protein n=1 Tax=Oribacterium sp. C9 TaxID=1943579 RepID=UPI00098F7B7A|nr:ABC transporter ATP-binding protein [Oribacterium sp. C9]OON84752.1 ABC transporter ATP-binding protein [Oribacterium sp. C9]
MITVRDIKKSYGTDSSKNLVLKGVSCEFESGEKCAIVGSSGSGKSTLINCIGGLENIDDGEIIINGIKINKLGNEQLRRFRRDNLGFVFQFYNLLPNLCVRDNIRVGEKLSKNPMDYGELLRFLDLERCEYQYPSELSGGQQQRVSIARALIKNSPILLCDEPTGALDSVTSKEILKLLETINKKYGTTIIMVTHNSAIPRMMDTTIMMKDGMIVDIKKNQNPVSAEELTDL